MKSKGVYISIFIGYF